MIVLKRIYPGRGKLVAVTQQKAENWNNQTSIVSTTAFIRWVTRLNYAAKMFFVKEFLVLEGGLIQMAIFNDNTAGSPEL